MSYFCSFPPKFTFPRCSEEFLFPLTNIQNIYHIDNQLVIFLNLFRDCPYFIITYFTFYENQHFNSPPTTIQKLFCSYILVGDFTIIPPISFAIKWRKQAASRHSKRCFLCSRLALFLSIKSLKLIRVWQMKLLLISCRRRWVI